jgi:stage II sporulation protein E
VDADAPVAAVFDRAADIVCRSCGGKEQCWKKDHTDTVQALAGLTDTMVRKGTLTVGDLPMNFRQKCVAPSAFVSAVNGELRGLLYRRQYTARLQESRAAAYGQFLDMASVLGRAAEELGGTAGPDALAERRLIRFLKSHDREGVCAAFRDGRGRLHAALEGVDIETLAEEPDYLERLSEVVGVRLCRVEKGEKGHLVLRQAEPLAVSVGIASMKKEGENVSGDRGTYFKTDSGLLCVILSDGMGTGEAAAKESVSAVEILEQLLKAGMEPECAMRLLNAAALLNNGEDWGYATVDLCCIDLFSGDTRFYKYGAAPSYVKTGRAIRRVKCTSLAAGMLAGEESAPDVVKLRLKPGNVALIASDGVMAERQDGWLRSILADCDGWDTSQIARQTLKAAVARFGNADDMTALAIRVEERL